jgi:hypothetical protein
MPDPLTHVLRFIEEARSAGQRCRLDVRTDDGAEFGVTLPPLPRAAAAPPAWVPNDNQACVLEALEGRALRTDALARASGVDRRALFQKPGGLDELQAVGAVRHHPRLGFYRTDAPPPDISQESA